MSESQAICEYLEETPRAAADAEGPDGRYEVRRLCAWFDDKFHNEVTSKLLYERVNKKVTGQGYPDSPNVKAGPRRIKYHLDYMAWLLWTSGAGWRAMR
jgi:glutathione S-transferase